MLKNIALAGLALCFASPALAGDMNWTGLYLGAHAGWSDWALERPDDPTSPTQSFDGAFGGGQLGFDYQTSSGIVLGAVADVSFGDLSNEPVTDGGTIMVNSDIDTFGTIRGRLGYSFGRWLPYATAGGAWMSGSTTEVCPTGAQFGHCSRAGAYTESGDLNRWGWAYGGGVEVKLTQNVSLFAEYLRLDFGTETEDLGPKSWDREVKIEDVDVVRAGVNFKFGGREEAAVPLK
jgi:outer membrane autotransporter protein